MSEKRFKLITPLGTRLGLTDISIKDTQKDYYYNTKEMVVDLLNRLSEENEQLRKKNKQIGFLKRDLFILLNLIKDNPMEHNLDYIKIKERWE